MTSGNWPDLVQLFEGKGGPHYCWCMVWRKMASGDFPSVKAQKKASLKKYVTNGTPVGLIGYYQNDPIAWCSVAPRESFKELGGDPAIDKVWSLVCFFIQRAHRGRDLSRKLISGAIQYARENDAEYLEAYPTYVGSPSYRFMGFRPVFEDLGFEFRHKAGKRRNVMVIRL